MSGWGRYPAYLACFLLFIVPLFPYELVITNRFITNEIYPAAVVESDIISKRFLDTNENLRMRSVSALLTPGEREDFYRKYRKNDGLITGSFLLDLLCPGAGNLLIGDSENGLSLMIPALIGGGVMVFGLVNDGSGGSGNTPSTGVNEVAIVGGAVLLVCEVLGVMNLLSYANGWNQSLKRGLDLAYEKYPLNLPLSAFQTTENQSSIRFVICRF